MADTAKAWPASFEPEVTKMLLFLVSWLVLSVVGGVFIGTAIHLADAMDVQRLPYGRPAQERPQPDAPGITASASAFASGAVPTFDARAA